MKTDKILKKYKTKIKELGLFFNSPVYLVGSALIKESPRDIDIRLILSIKRFEELFGSIDKYKYESQSGKWTDNCCVKWSNLCNFFYEEYFENDPKIDFQICYEEQYNEPRKIIS